MVHYLLAFHSSCSLESLWRSRYSYVCVCRYEKLPGVDVFVCTADPTIEPPIMVINTVLSVMAFSYPSENLSVYLSDDGGSELTFYALLEQLQGSKFWIPFCKKFKVEPRSPSAYLSNPTTAALNSQEWSNIKVPTTFCAVISPSYAMNESKLQRSWEGFLKKFRLLLLLSATIQQSFSRDPHAVDIEGCKLPTLVYLAREKNQQHHHNFKAGALNAL
ncbi:hypothetical protein MKW92_044799, partial [Papaver armeniacum]